MYFFDHKLTPAGFIFVIRAPPCPPVTYSDGVPHPAPRFITARHVRSCLNPFVPARRCGRFTADCATIPSFIVKEKLAAINTFQELTLTHVAAYIRPRIHSAELADRVANIFVVAAKPINPAHYKRVAHPEHVLLAPALRALGKPILYARELSWACL